MSCESEVFEILESNSKSKDPLLVSYIRDARKEYEEDMQSASDEDIQERFAFQYHVTALHIQTGNVPRLLRQYYDNHRNPIDAIIHSKSSEEIEAYIEEYRNLQPEEQNTREIAA